MPYISEPTQIFLGYFPDNTSSPQYTVPAGKKLILSAISVVHNGSTTSASETAVVHIVPSAGSVGNEYKVLSEDVTPTFSGTIEIPRGLVLNAGDKLYLSTDTASTLSGIVVGAVLTEQ